MSFIDGNLGPSLPQNNYNFSIPEKNKEKPLDLGMTPATLPENTSAHHRNGHKQHGHRIGNVGHIEGGSRWEQAVPASGALSPAQAAPSSSNSSSPQDIANIHPPITTTVWGLGTELLEKFKGSLGSQS